MSSNFKYKLLIGVYFLVLITSLWPNNIYILVGFSILSWIILPIQKWWNIASVTLLIFSLLYAIMEFLNQEVGSGFILLSHIIAPVSFYRFGRYIMSWLSTNRSRLIFLFATILCYLLPLFLLTAQDIALVGFVNESRTMLSDSGNDNTLAATLYGLMSSFGIGCIAILFTKQQNIYLKLGYVLLSLITMVIIIHLVNRTGIVIFIGCILVSFVITTKLEPIKIIPALILLGIIIFIVIKFGIISPDVIDAYAKREDSTTANASEFGGRAVIWADALDKLLTHPFGWERIRYAHNLWLDIARIGGWLALIPFLFVTFNSLKSVISILKRETYSSDILLITIFTSTFLNACVEPVIEGSMLFFSLLLMLWGMIENASLEKTYVIHYEYSIPWKIFSRKITKDSL